MLDRVTDPQTRAEMIARYKAARERLSPKPPAPPRPKPAEVELRAPSVIEIVEAPEPPPIRVPTLRYIQVTVATHFNIPHLALLSHRRQKDLIFPRMVAIWLCSRLTVKTVTQLGVAFSDRDHSTIIHSIKRIDMLRDIDPHVLELTAYFIRILEPAAPEDVEEGE
jgi:chromosomal replication initiator protein